MEISQLTLYKLITSYSPYNTTNEVIDDFQVIQKTLTSSDDEDGGGHYDVILKKISTNRFFEASYCDWDIDENTEYDEDDEDSFESDLDNDLVEVVPEEITVTVYKPKK